MEVAGKESAGGSKSRALKLPSMLPLKDSGDMLRVGIARNRSLVSLRASRAGKPEGVVIGGIFL